MKKGVLCIEILTFISLNKEKREALFCFLNDISDEPPFNNFNTMIKDFSGHLFNYGKEYFTVWENDQLKATLGLITIDIETRGEAFITSIFAYKDGDKYIFNLLEKVKETVNKTDAKFIRLGVSKGREYLIPTIIKLGFEKSYDMVTLKFEDMNALSKIEENSNFEYRNLTKENTEIFRTVHNKAFIASPNGGMMRIDEAKEIASYNKNTDWSGICYFKKNPVAIYQSDVKEDTVWIENIGVLPKYQGIGIGKLLLKKAVNIAQREKYNNIKLYVVTSNEIAYKAYLKYGFKFYEQRAAWFSMKIN
ncbi:GNAT family N-acetyltransferase [Clostridium sp. DL1XJH146]